VLRCEVWLVMNIIGLCMWSSILSLCIVGWILWCSNGVSLNCWILLCIVIVVGCCVYLVGNGLFVFVGMNGLVECGIICCCF